MRFNKQQSEGDKARPAVYCLRSWVRGKPNERMYGRDSRNPLDRVRIL